MWNKATKVRRTVDAASHFVPMDVFMIPNNMDGFSLLLQRIQDCTNSQDKIKVGLEATGHYSYNLLGFLLDNGLTTEVGQDLCFAIPFLSYPFSPPPFIFVLDF